MKWADFFKKVRHAKRVGRIGEAIAVRLLQAQGCTILARNFRSKRYEIDIVARDGGILCFIEVKTRTRLRNVPPPPLQRQQKIRIVRAAQHYLQMLDHPRIPCRFDLIDITLYPYPFPVLRKIKHYRDYWAISLSRK